MRLGLLWVSAVAITITVALLGCGSAETLSDPGETSKPPSSGSGVGGPACVNVDPSRAAPENGCGVFVSSTLGSDDNPGTREQPVQTLRTALTLALDGARRVYACAEMFHEAAEVPAGMEVWGGLDCADGWTHVGDTTKTTIAPGEPGVIALRLLAGEGRATIVDVRAEAESGAEPGASSIAALVEPGAAAVIQRCELVARDGAEGAEGEPGGGPGAPPQAQAGADGLPGSNACGADVILGGAAVVTSCDGVESIGGKGGNGRATYGDDGEDGQPVPEVTQGQKGKGGFGQNGDHTQCMSGWVGHAGLDGAHGLGAHGLGRITLAGWEGVAGEDGTDGLPGQGGGGGGGMRGPLYTECGVGQPRGGASGGSGGAGGCGGKGGKGGGSGGASIGLVTLSADITLQDTIIITGHGGNGGRGGLWQGGGLGGDGGVGGVGWYSGSGCGGGRGGQGGNGGFGGGGLGGPTLGIAHVIAQPVTLERVTFTIGSAGKGGDGGSPFVTLPGTTGEDGLEADVQGFAVE
ncbi:MAG TPA: hypothetical protein VLS89_14370 [Candidatus Nanopelagicales bacterium]|nr:hypothetical protein [Candidatus Nanopelagicales bacterium]